MVSNLLKRGGFRGAFGVMPIAFVCLILGDFAFGVTGSMPKKPLGFVTDPSTLKPSLSLPVLDSPVDLPMSRKKLEKRAAESPKDIRVEPVEVVVSTNSSERRLQCEELASPGNSTQLLNYFDKRLKGVPEAAFVNGKATLNLDASAFDLVRIDKLGHSGLKIHHRVTVDGHGLRADLRSIKTLGKQLVGFIPEAERDIINAKLKAGMPVKVDTELLPAFARRMVGKYLIYRGPNCFHAALAFHGSELTKSPLLNVRREEGYHPAMVNYDELWRVLESQFYEVNTQKSPLKYGDLLVFFDREEGKPIDYKWIRHAAVYLFNNFTFSKGSKSPNTPYSVKTVTDEWNTWQQYSKNLGVKVFRRASKNAISFPPEVMTDWLY